MNEIFYLVKKDIQLEWRNKNAINGIILYLISTIFICYMSFKLKVNQVDPIVWNTLFWIILLFTSINSLYNGFYAENNSRHLYYYGLINPEYIILSKIIYNTCLLIFIGVLGNFIYSQFMENPVQNKFMYFISVLIGCSGFASCLTLLSAIASKASNTAGLMAVLSFPVILPMLLMLIKFSKNAMDGLPWNASYDELLVLIGIQIIIIVLSFILFPFLWRS